MRVQARKQAESFLAEQSEYRMGYIEAELPNPATRALGETFRRSPEEGIRLLLSVDRALADTFARVLASEEYARFAKKIQRVLGAGGRIVLSGCGSSGRLCMRLESSWRTALYRFAQEYPARADSLMRMRDQLFTIMTGGDYAVIRAVEAFEDYASLGREQARCLGVGAGDLLLGVTATAETASILGTAAQALEDGADVYMLVCSDPAIVSRNMARARAVYMHPRTAALYLPCGPMALTGSTRMQSSTIEQAVCAVALQTAMDCLLSEKGIPCPERAPAAYAAAFTAVADSLRTDVGLAPVSSQLLRETACYSQNGLVTYFADECLLDVLTDTTERAPTFMTPPFRSADAPDAPVSWAFVKNPNCPTREAWHRCFARSPRCIDWPPARYESLGLSPEAAARVPAIDAEALYGFDIGNEPCPEREQNGRSLATWVGLASPPPAFTRHAARYKEQSALTLAQTDAPNMKTPMRIFEHLAMKLILNALSTGTMACMGRITGNQMTWLAMSNKKLIDRSARIVSEQCGVAYPRALQELFYSVQWIRSQGDAELLSPAQVTIRRLNQNGEVGA